MRILATTTALALFILDQALKLIAQHNGPSAGLYTYTLNTGMTFGFFPNANTAMIVISVIALALLVYVIRTEKNYEFFGLALIIAGVLSNGIDRLVHGGVIDYIRIGTFPVFNIADALIITGVAVLIGLEAQKTVQKSSKSSRSSK